MAHLSQEYIQELYDRFGELKVVDDIVRHRAADEVQVPILGYPRSENDVADYERFTGKQLNVFVDHAVKYFISSGLRPDTHEVVALLAPSDLSYVVSFFALSRLGYTVLSLSLRIPPVAIINLLQKTSCRTTVHGQSTSIEANLHGVNDELSITQIKIPMRDDYDKPAAEPLFKREFDRQEENDKPALILHSSGSTGLPKPVTLNHRAMLTHPPQGSGLHNFNTLPWYHMYGLSTAFQAMWMGKTAYMFSATLPMTADNLVAVVEAVQPQAIHAVPYALGLLAEKKRGLDAMRACKMVTAAGARTPDELGDLLVSEGVNLGVVFGSTEAGLAGDTMRRDKGDNSWQYLRLYANIRKFIYMSPLGNNLYECVYLKGHPALSVSNSDDPAPGSFHSKDVFAPHPTIPDAWKYVTRIDDRVTLLNGEKVLPLPIEGCIRGNELVREVVVVGIDQSIPGLLVFRAKEGDHLSDEAYLDAIWPSVEDANSRAEAFSQITKDMITVMPSDVDYPQTDKGSVIRAQAYRKFGDKITEMYARLEENQEGTLKLDLPGIEEWLMATFKTVGIPLESLESDFFEGGVDSLKAIQIRRVIQKTLELNGKKLSRNVVYESGNAKRLAKYLYAFEEDDDQKNALVLMRELIDKYSNFEPHRYLNGVTTNGVNGEVSEPKRAAIITGTTGSIGAHVLYQLLANDSFSTIYCPVRAGGANPVQRVLDSLQVRGLPIKESAASKIVAFTSDLRSPDLDVTDSSILSRMRTDVSLIIHIAWPVNFNISLQSFEPHIVGLHNLLQFSLSVHRHEPAQLLFCSSISTASETPAPASIPEAPIEDFTQASRMGYGQSKLVSEHIVQNAARVGARGHVLRIGQIVGDKRNGVWNDAEFVPSIIRSALTLKALPSMPNEFCSWLPVDTLATTILELSHTSPPTKSALFYNLTNPHAFSWDADLLPALQSTALGDFNTVPFGEWLQKIQQSAALDSGASKNPAVKLIGYFERGFGAREGLEGNGIVFETEKAQRDSAALKDAPNVLAEGYVGRFVERWMEKWRV